MIVVKAPEKIPENKSKPTVFLAGSIEMGAAKQWQNEVTEALSEKDIMILNPRRDDWNASWVQRIDNPEFDTQVNWELDAQDAADVIAMYFEPSTASPISLLELGLYASSGKLIVCCPEGFWRKGNVDIVCQRYGIPIYTNTTDFVNAIKEKC